MAQFIFMSSLLLVLWTGWTSAGIRDLKNEIPYTKTINARLCEDGAHPDSVAQEFFACYDEEITPGGSKFVECQQRVYGVLMDTESNLDKVCTASKTAFPRYAACIMTKLVASGNRPSKTFNKLNECQGGVLGVPRPN